MTRFRLVTDFLFEEIQGGCELNDKEVASALTSMGHEVGRTKSAEYSFTESDEKVIVSNFVSLSERNKALLQENGEYIIYEHDHKYLKNRNPALYMGFVAPANQIVNRKFYENAKAVLCQSSFQKEILEKNLGIGNVVNLSGNLWSIESLQLMRELSSSDKNDCCSIMSTSNWHKNTKGSVQYCNEKKLPYQLIGNLPYDEFLRKMGSNKKVVFFPKTPETLSRIVVECRMMGMSAVINKLVGASYEEWFPLKGEALVDVMTEKRKEIPETIVRIFDE